MPEYHDVVDGLQMPLADALETQRAVRRLKPDPVDDKILLDVLRLATKAPSGSNAQSWEFLIVRDPEVKHQLARLNRQAWSVYRRFAKSRARGDLKMARSIAAVQWQADHFEEAPVIVVACLKGRALPSPTGRAAFYGSIFPAVQNLLLAARAVGLGATLTTFPLWSRGLARRTLNLPSNVTPCAVVPMGWPRGGGYGPTTRRPVEEVIHLDRYGNRPFAHEGHTGPPSGAPGTASDRMTEQNLASGPGDPGSMATS